MSDDFDDLMLDVAMPTTAPQTGSTATLADLLGVSPRMVTELAQRGLLVRAGRGLWDLRESVRTYTAHLREQAAGRGATASMTTERLRLVKEQADGVAMKNAALRRELVPAAEVESAWAAVLRDVRAAMLAISSRCGASLPHLTLHDIAAIDREVRDVLTETAR